MYNPYGNQMYLQDLQGLRDRIDRQMQMVNQNQPQTTPITQNFQLAPTQHNKGLKYVDSIDEVKKEVVFEDTLFINKNFSLLWYKNVGGDIKVYELMEVIEKDPKDLEIEELKAKISLLEKEKNNERYDDKHVTNSTSREKSTSSKSDTTSNE